MERFAEKGGNWYACVCKNIATKGKPTKLNGSTAMHAVMLS
jgi:hypothetical protein